MPFNNVCLRKLHYLTYYWTSFIPIPKYRCASLDKVFKFYIRDDGFVGVGGVDPEYHQHPVIHYHLILLLLLQYIFSTFIIIHNRPTHQCCW